MRTARDIERWLAREIHGRDIPRKPPQRSSALYTGPARNYRYRAWIRSLPSAASGNGPCQACHTGAHGFGEKSSDYSCIPLTWEEHRAYDQDPEGFSAKHELDVKSLVRRLNRIWFVALREGC